MMALLTSWGLSRRAAKLVGYIALPLLILALLWGALTWYGKARYNAGRADEEQAWQEASDRLKAKAIHAAGSADEAAAVLEHQHTAEVALEKEKLDAAAASGDSAFNVLFPEQADR
jgi:hypothetical protein